MKRALKLFVPYLMPTVLLIAVTYLVVMANLRLPDEMADIIDQGIVQQNMDQIWQHGFTMIWVTLGGSICSIAAAYLASRIATGYSRDLRLSEFQHIESFAIADFNKFSTASLITRSTNDVQQIQMTFTILLRVVLMAPIMAIGGLQKALQTAPNLSWIIAVSIIAMLCLVAMLFTVAVPRFQILQSLVDKLNLVTRENLTGLRVVRAFNNEPLEVRKFKGVNKNLTDMNIFVNRLMILIDPFMMLTMNLTSIAVIWFGALAVGNGSLEIGNMMAFFQYAAQVIISFLMISMIFIMVPRAVVSLRRIGEVLSTKPSVVDPAQPQKLNANGVGRIEFSHVTFSYPGAEQPVLTDISFTAESGETTAFIGSTGSGKSTLINLIPRFYDVTAGTIALDGVNIRDLRLSDLYSQIGFAPQKGVLFSGTVKSNIMYGNHDMDDAEIQHAAEIAQADDFIHHFKQAYDSHIAQGGSNVSGGQRQRLSIARALAVNPKVYVFDDSFSALDFKTDAALRADLRHETKGKTVMIVGQRIGTIMDADKIIVLDEGKIVGQGKHDELMKTCPVYREIAESQLSDEELKNV